ncbi:MAG TPA: phage portal protein, partial [Candidatus Megaira endosymbiont of Hartmannula sinica]|nr:phage portal protein [Candidatus Megaera endosymbiont of Hartmannula sinica]
MIKKYFNKLFAKNNQYHNNNKINKNTNFNGSIFNKSNYRYNNSYSYIDNLSKVELYSKNVIIHRCINLIASSASHVPFYLKRKFKNKIEIDNNHKISKLLFKPRNNVSGADFFYKLICNFLLYGNAYVKHHSYDNNHEIFNIDPSDIKIIQ